MAIPLQITFRGLPRSESIEANIIKHVEKLDRLKERITRCKVVVEFPHKRHQHGNVYAVRVDLRTPLGEIAVSRYPNADHSHEDMHVAIRDAFLAIERRLDDERSIRRDPSSMRRAS